MMHVFMERQALPSSCTPWMVPGVHQPEAEKGLFFQSSIYHIYSVLSPDDGVDVHVLSIV